MTAKPGKAEEVDAELAKARALCESDEQQDCLTYGPAIH